MPVQTEACCDRLTAVAVGVDVTGYIDPSLRIVSASDAPSALRLVRNTNAELLVTGIRVGDAPPWSMIRGLRIARPWQHWALAADTLSDAEEIEARSLRVSAIFGAAPDISALLALADAIKSGRRRESHALVFTRKIATRARGVAGPIERL